MANRYLTTVDPSGSNNPHTFALELVGHDHTVLEVGCSTGHVTTHLVAAGNTVTGIEIDAEAAAQARTVTDTVHVLDLDFTPVSTVEPGPFDVVLLGDVLEHVRDPAAVLADLATVLGPDGRMVISIPNAAHIDVRLMLLEGRIEYQDHGLLDRTHLRWFTKASLRDLLTECGLVATELRRVVFPRGGSNVPFDDNVHYASTLTFIEADPEALSYQYVVECQPRARMPDASDALAPTPHEWPAHSCEAIVAQHEALLDRIGHLEAEVQAWENSRVVRLTRPVRALLDKLTRRSR